MRIRYMSIRTKATMIIIVTVAVLLLSIFGFSKLIWQRSINSQEDSLIRDKVAEVQKLLEYQCASINPTVSDWAIFDDTYKFMNDKNKTYLASNLQNVTFEALKMNFIMYVDNNGSIVYEKGYDLDNKSVIQVPKELHDSLVAGGSITANRNVEKTIYGLIPTQNRILMISSNPISTSGGESATNGILVMARYMTKENIEFIEKLSNTRILIDGMNRILSVSRKLLIFNTILNDGVQLERPDEQKVVGYKQINDINNNAAMLLNVEMSREAYNQGKKEQKVLTISIVACMVVVFAAFLAMIQRIVIRRIENLNRFVKEVTLSGEKNARINLSGSDEISSLSGEINSMLERINNAEQEIMKKEKQLEMVLEGSNDGFWDWNINRKEMMYSDRAIDMLGYRPDEIGNDETVIFQLTHPDDIDGVAEALGKTLNGAASTFGREYRIQTRNGVWKWFLIRGKVAEYNNDGTPGRMAGTITDISDRKKTEEEIRYLSYNDKLTSLHNRAFFEKEMEYVDSTSELPYTFIIGDLNGLKIANDVFGHDEGDRLLKEIAAILKKSCRETDVVSRWGGDEFAILLKSSDEKTAEIVCRRIKEGCESSGEGLIKPSIALGVATKYKQADDMANIVREAEARMYRSKTQEGRTNRMKILESLKQELQTKSYENMEHYRLIRELAMRFGEELQLNEEEMEQLLLLGEYHDLGEITLPESILRKQGELSAEEWEEIRKHPETGYRVAKTIPEIAQIADKIVNHHERYDGSGYPNGTKGKDIPLVSRVFAIIDAYASMICEESYRKPMDKMEALQEIARNAGSQFDPILAAEFKGLFL